MKAWFGTFSDILFQEVVGATYSCKYYSWFSGSHLRLKIDNKSTLLTKKKKKIEEF